LLLQNFYMRPRSQIVLLRANGFAGLPDRLQEPSKMHVRCPLLGMSCLVIVAGCSQNALVSPPAIATPKAPEPVCCRLVEPSTSHRIPVTTLHTLKGMEDLVNARVMNLNAFNDNFAKEDGWTPITKTELPKLLAGAHPVAPDADVIDDWHYAPYYFATIEYQGHSWSVELFLGGLGTLTDHEGRTGAFMYKRVDANAE
jgi:hypothetical protein